MSGTDSFLSGIRGNKRFVPLLTQWLKLLETYGECWKWEDCAWYHRELSSVSFFAGSVWTLGGLVLQEYTTRKLIKGNESDGRCDLYFGLPRQDGTFEHFDAEAKHGWYILDGPKAASLNQIKKALDRACYDAGNLPDHSQRLGICFISFCVKKARTRTLTNAEVESVKAALAMFISATNDPNVEWFDAAAWFFAEDAKLATCPGVAVFIRTL